MSRSRDYCVWFADFCLAADFFLAGADPAAPIAKLPPAEEKLWFAKASNGRARVAKSSRKRRAKVVMGGAGSAPIKKKTAVKQKSR